MSSRVAVIIMAFLSTMLVACSNIQEDQTTIYGAIDPLDYPQVAESTPTGGLFQVGNDMSLFSDIRAHRVGDIVSVLLIESTNASKSSDTDVDKSNSVDITSPTVFGAPVTINGRYDLGVSLESESGFEGGSASTQSNALQGTIAVQVADVLPNGNLYIQGEKWIKINQGDEYIQLRGIVRPADLSPTNTIPSTLIADARISYGGTGIGNEANTPGWLTRFFMSPIVPF